jgi:hypothetical protein
VPGNASGGMDGVALKGLTVDFHEPGFVGQIAGENNQPFWFQMSGEQQQQAGRPWGPTNPQALNRYSYVQNNPLKYTDPTGHANKCPECSGQGSPGSGSGVGGVGGGGGGVGGGGGGGIWQWLKRVFGLAGSAASADGDPTNEVRVAESALEDLYSRYGSANVPVDKAVNLMIKAEKLDGSPEAVKKALFNIISKKEALMNIHTPPDVANMLEDLQSPSFSLSKFITDWHLDINVRW